MRARAWMRRWRWAAVPAVLGVAAGGVVLTGASSASATYRTAEVSTGDVTQTLTATGSISSASRYDVTFQVDGTVSRLTVAVGDTVEAGDVLAGLDTSDLEDAVTEAEEALADAEEALADDLAAQSSDDDADDEEDSTTSASVATSTTVTTALYVPGSTAVTAVATGSDDADADAASADADEADATDATETTDATDETDAVDTAREALVDAQTALLEQYDAAQALLVAAQDAAATAQETCAEFTDAADVEPASGEGVDAADASSALGACQAATAEALAASQASIDAQAVLMELAAGLDEAVDALLDALDADESDETDDAADDASGSDGAEGAEGAGPGGGSSGPAAGMDAGSGVDQGAGEAPTADATEQSSASGAGAVEEAVPTAADILADKAEITLAEAELAVAQQQLEYAVLSAPVAGEVVAVGMDEDATVTGGDASTAITIVADNTYLVELAVSLTEVQLLEVGQEATLTLTHTGEVVDGVVSSVSNVNSGNSFAQSYAVTIAVPDPGLAIRIGAATRMQIAVAGAAGVLVVPTSAVTDAAGDATVQVLGEDGVPAETPVVVGAIGSVYTEIVSGVEAGAEVVLADLTADLTGDEDAGEDGSSGLLDLGSSEDSAEDTQVPQAPPGGGRPGATG